MADVVVIGAGPAGVVAASRAAELGAKTTLVTCEKLGGMAANDGPIPVRTLAHAARLIREARQLGRYGISVSEPELKYSRLIERVNEVTRDVRTHSLRRESLEQSGVTIHEDAGRARLAGPNNVEAENGLRLKADRIILCGGGVSRRLPVPGFELTVTHADAWALKSTPSSMMVIGAGATGVQVASIFNAFGSKVHLFQAAPRILTTEDEDVSTAVASAFRASGITVHEDFGSIDSFEKTPDGVRMTFTKNGVSDSAEAALAVVAVGWVADTDGLNLEEAGVELNARGFISVDSYLKTSAPNIFAAGDISGRLMLAPQASQDGYVAATNAVCGLTISLGDQVSPTGSFTEPEYGQVGLTEAMARKEHDVVVATMSFDETARTIIDGRTTGFCKLIADRQTRAILGCHVVGERAVEIVQVVAVAMVGRLGVDDLARIPLSFPTYAGILVRVALRAAKQLNIDLGWQSRQA